MALVTIAISEDDLRIARAQAARSGFPAIEAYLQQLVAEQLQCESDEGLGAPHHLDVASKERAASLIREGLASPAREMTPSDLAAFRSELTRAHQGKTP